MTKKKMSILKRGLILVKENFYKKSYEDWEMYLGRMWWVFVMFLFHLFSLVLPVVSFGWLKGLIVSAFLFILYTGFAFNAEYTLVLAVAAMLFSIAVPSFVDIKHKAQSAAAMNTVATVAKECAVKKAMGEKNPAIKVTQLEKHKITPLDGNCDGDKKGLITAVSTDLYKYPTFIYNIQTGEKTCFHNGVKWDVDEERHYHGCTAKKNGTWFEITQW